MPRLWMCALSVACAAAQFVTPVPAELPAWLAPYPGANPANRKMANSVESSYTVAAPARDVLAHFRSLFASAGVTFRPDSMGYGFFIRAAAPECDLAISIQRRDPGTSVKVNCSPRLAVNDRMANLHEQERAEHAQSDPMKKFDSPVYPQPKPPEAPLTWPSWLVRVDGARLPVEKHPGQLRSSFTSLPTREAIQAFYADLLGSHNFRVTRSVAQVSEKSGSWVEGSSGPDNEFGRRVVIWVKIRPAGKDFVVDISMQ